MKKLLAIALAAAMTASLTACGEDAKITTAAPKEETTAGEEAAADAGEKKTGSEMTWKLATDAARDYPTTKALIRFADEMYERSEGRIAVDIYESSILGDEISYMEQLQTGTVDVAKLSIGTLSGLYEEIKTIEDFKGKAIRVQNNQLMNSMIDCLGANPVNVAANEVYSALQTGVCKGGENNPNIILSDSLYEVAPYVLLDNHTTTMDVICMNLDLWNSLSEEDQTIVREAMAAATEYDREIWDASVEEALKKLEEGGATVVQPDDAVLDSFRAAMDPIYEEYAGKYETLLNMINEDLK